MSRALILTFLRCRPKTNFYESVNFARWFKHRALFFGAPPFAPRALRDHHRIVLSGARRRQHPSFLSCQGM